MRKSLNDIRLWELCRAGDKEAFEQLFKFYYRFLYHYGLKHTSNQVLLEDCVQELFVELWEKAPATEIQSFRAYLFQSFRFRLYRQIQKSDQYNKVKEAGDDGSLFTGSVETLIIKKEEGDERAKQLQTAISQLSKRQQEIIYLRFYNDLEYEEICAIMQISYQVSRNLLYQAIKALKKVVISPSFSAILAFFI
ncbi:RNA polymerase sigma factor [Chitinophagaceae bacterium LWZ2-11]